ncbi:MAG: hypothetical protein HQL55_15220, partial [Magnetococcales bacterium]|nr:hypothetical protein [Magnetococcales bacterium]
KNLLQRMEQAALIPGLHGTVTGTILNEDAAPSFSISGGKNITEGQTVTFTVTRDGNSEQAQTVNFGLGAGSAGSADFSSATSGTLTFTQGQFSQTFTVSTTQDTLFENNESFTATLSNATLNGGIVVATASSTILNTDAVPSFSISGSSVTEGSAVTFTVTRNGDSQDAQTVDFNTNTGSAGSKDFTSSTNGTITFTQGQYSQTFTVNTSQDTLYENTEVFSATLSNASLGGSIITPTASGTILSDDAAPSFSISSESVSEDGILTFTISRNGDAQYDQNVSYEAWGGSASSNDYANITSTTLTFSQGQYSQTFTVDTAQDTLYEGDETFRVSLTNEASFGGVLTSNGTGTILNDDILPSFAISGGGGITEGLAVTFTVTRNADTQNNQTVAYGTNTGTATSGDFTAKSGTLTFTQGQLSQTFTVTSNSDTVYEGDEGFYATLASPSAGGITTATASATLLNNDQAPTFSISSGSFVSEGNAVTFSVTRTGDAQQEQTVQFAAVNGTTENADITATKGTLTFTAGETVQIFSVATANDSLYEGTETFTTTLSSPNFGSLGSSTATVTILDNDAIPTVSIAASSATEGSVITFTVTRTGDAEADQLISYKTSLGTAGSDDFKGTSNTLTFVSGQSSNVFTVTTIDDTTLEANETFTASLGVVNFGNLATTLANGTILNDEPAPTYSISGPSSATEGNFITFTVTRDLDTLGETIGYGINPNTGETSDYTNGSGTLTFAVNQATATFTVNITNDSLYEGNESFAATLVSPSFGTIGTGTSTFDVVNINPSPSFGVSSNSVTEGSEVTFTVSRVGNAEANQTVLFATSTGSAVSEDFTGKTATLTFSQGQLSQAVTVATNNDSIYETSETFSATLSNPSLGGTFYAPTATVTITDNDNAPTFSMSSSTVTEGSFLTLTVTRSNDAYTNQTVQYGTLGGSANESDDYTGVFGTLTFTPGQLSQTFTVSTVNDSIYETNEYFTTSLANVSPFGGVSNATASHTIIDNDAAPVFSIAAASANEGSPVTFTVSRTADSSTVQTIRYGTVQGTADSSNDYQSAGGTLTFSPGNMSKTFTVSTYTDTSVENNETFSATLSSLTGAGSIGTSTAAGTILNNDFTTFSIANASANEGNAITFTVTRSGSTSITQQIQYTISDGTATSDDYTGKSSTLTFGTGQSSLTFSTTTTGDSNVEGNETFNVSLTSSSTGVAFGTSSATGTILNDDAAPTFTITIDSNTKASALNFESANTYILYFDGRPFGQLDLTNFGTDDRINIKRGGSGAIYGSMSIQTEYVAGGQYSAKDTGGKVGVILKGGNLSFRSGSGVAAFAVVANNYPVTVNDTVKSYIDYYGSVG